MILLLALSLLPAPGLVAQASAPEAQSRIAPLFREARAADHARDFEKAAGLYRQVLKLAPDLAEAWTNLGLVLYELNRHSEALASFAKAAELKPQLFVPQLFLGIEYLRQGQATKAVAPLRAALRLQPGHTQATYELARAYVELGNFEQAAGEYRRLLGRAPEMEQAWYGLGIAYLNWSKGAARQLLASRPPSPYGNILLAEFLAASGAASAAEENYKAAVDALPSEVEAHLGLGRFYRGRGNAEAIEKAEEEFAKARELESRAAASSAVTAPEPLEAAIARWRGGEYEKALEALVAVPAKSREHRAIYWLSRTCMALARETFLKAVERNPQSYRAHLLLADLARDQSDNATAEAEYRKAAALARSDPEVQLLFIQYLAARQLDEELFDRAGEVVRRFPHHPALNCEYAKLLLKRNRHSEAASYFEKSLQADPAFAAARAGLAEAHAAAGDIEKAIAEMKPALRADRDGSFHYRIARWYQETGRAREAREAFAATAKIKAEKLERDRVSFTRAREIGE